MFDSDLLNQLSEGVIVADRDGKLLFVNAAAERMHGVKALDVAPDSYSATYHLFTESGEPYPFEELPLARAVLQQETIDDSRWRIRRPDGSEVLAIGSARPLFRSGERVGAILTLRDDSARFAAERALRESEARFRNMADHAPVMMWVTDADGHCTYLNKGWYDFTGQTEAQALGFGWLNAVHPTDAAEAERAFVDANANSAPFRVDYRLRRADCVYRWVADAAAPRFGPDGQFLGFVGSVVDMDERKVAEEALRERSEEFYTLADNIPALAWMAYANGEIFWYNRRWYDYTGTTEVAQKGWGWQTVHDPDVLPAVVERWTQSLNQGTPFEMTFPLKGGDGIFRPFLTRVVPIRDEQGEIVRWFGTNVDISEQVEAEQAVTRLNETLERRVLEIAAERERAWQLSQELLAVVNADGSFAEVNVAWTKLLGWEREELLGQPFNSFTHPDDVDATVAKFAATLETPLTDPFEYRFRRKDGDYRWFSWTAVFQEGRVYASGRDVNEEKQRQAELEGAQEALRQSQKMEAIGQLTGGIAHDFNNLLQIISGNLDILSRSLTDDSPRLRRSIDNAAKGAERAAVLTQRLLAFSRRQPLAPKVIDPNKLVSGMSDMLHRTLGETYAIETVTGSGLWRVEADPNQLESALLNLAINARDAMPNGGKLTVETTNSYLDREYAKHHVGVSPGQYAVICVTDTGSGMDTATADRAVEPFFTTKEVGKGTGLGLSMVYGFVKQSGGHLKIYSEAGEGTTVKIYLPRHLGPEEEAEETTESDAPGGVEGETILVCEDDDDVRAYSVEVLRELGYRVIEAADGESALKLHAAENGQVDLLFSDIVLPGGMTGAVVAARARAVQPDLKVLFTTGYARNAIVHHGRLDAGVELLTKPFSYADLAARIRDLLDNQ